MKWKTAIIDRGVESTHSRLAGAKVDGLTIVQEPNAGFYHLPGKFDDLSGHGTAIAAIIHKIAPKTHLFSIKLQSAVAKLTEPLLVEGIKYCLTDETIKIINISLGLAMDEPSHELFMICKQASEEGKIIIASAYNFPDISCFPAYFSFVYGVSCGIVKNYLDYAYLGEGNINVLAKGTTQRVAWVKDSFRITTGTSFATAHFTGIVCKFLEGRENFSRDEVNAIVARHSNSHIPKLYYVKKTKTPNILSLSPQQIDETGRQIFSAGNKLGFVGKIALFPASEKEIQTIIEFRNDCRFEISFFLDYPRRIVSSLYAGKKQNDFTILNKELTKENYESFDTIVIGYFLDQYIDANIIFGINLLKNCIQRHKNFIVWDLDVYLLIQELVKESDTAYQGKIFFQSIQQDDLTAVEDYKQLPGVNVPVLAVIGTGSMQGKMTAQLRIKNILSRKGYNVTHLSTEPQGVILGAAYSFPYGFKSIVKLGTDDWISFLNICLKGIQKYNEPSIIITGTQGGVLPRTQVNMTGNVLSTMQFLIGVKPDAVICAINPNDDITLVRQTLDTIHNFCKVPALFCIMTPWNRKFLETNDKRIIANYNVLTKEELGSRMEEYSEQLNMLVLDIADTDNDGRISDIIINYFSSGS